MRFLLYGANIFCIGVLSFFVKIPSSGQTCSSLSNSITLGEELTYQVSYNWFIVWTNVGEIKLNIKVAEYNGKEAYHVIGEGKTFKSWDWFFKVRDLYESYIDPQTWMPLFFKRDIREGSYTQFTSYNYDFDGKRIFSKNKVKDNPLKFDTVAISNCTFDICSALYYCRSLDFNTIRKGDTISLTIILDQELYKINFIYNSDEIIDNKTCGRVNCKKLIISLVEGTVFKENDYMTLWVTDDKNLIPVYAESPLSVGSVKVLLVNFKGNRYPINISETLNH
jgi:hypothetical protein